MPKTYMSWKEKLDIVREAYSKEKHIKPTATKYHIQSSQIRRWKRRWEHLMSQKGMTEAKKQHLLSLKTTQKGPHRKEDNGVYDALKLYYENLRNQGKVVTVPMLCNQYKVLSNSNASISCLEKRIYRWLHSEKLIKKKPPTTGAGTGTATGTGTEPNVEANAEEENKVKMFLQYVNFRTALGRFPKSHVVNIDETNIDFDDLTGENTNGKKPKKKPDTKTVGGSFQCSIILGVAMDGTKLPPFVIYRGKQNGRIVREWTGVTEFPTTNFYAVQENAWVDQAVFNKWTQKVWKPYCNNKFSTYLLMDEFTVHLMPECVNPILQCRTNVDYTMQSYTSQLQVMDVGVTKPFKGYVKECYDRFVLENPPESKPSRLDIAKWIEEAWNKVSPEDIVNTWTNVGFVNNNEVFPMMPLVSNNPAVPLQMGTV